jgi:DNA-binding transcriptional MocR family regulator
MAMHISLVGRKDLSGEIYRQLRAAILNGQLRPGDCLTPSRELARALAVSRSTVVAGYERLAAEGFVTSRLGAGTFVREGLARSWGGVKNRSDGVWTSSAVCCSHPGIGSPSKIRATCRQDSCLDDYDSEFRFGDRPLEPLQTLDTRGRVIYVGSFSKTLLPSLRLGFMVIPHSLRLAVCKAMFVSHWHAPTLVQTALTYLIDDGEFARHIRRVNRIYRERHELAARAISRDFSEHLEVIPSTTGLHVAALARKASAEQIAVVARRAADDGIAIQTLSAFAVRGTGRAGIVLGYGAIPAGQIQEGLRRLRKCFDE